MSKQSKEFKVTWEKIFSEDAEIRIRRAFEMLLSDNFFEISDDQLKTTIDKGSLRTDNKANEETINKIIKPPRNS